MNSSKDLPPENRYPCLSRIEANRQRERDRWWLEMAIEFKIDKIGDRTVFIIKSGDDWFVVWSGLFLAGDQGFQQPSHSFSDREAALTAYQEWKQRQERK